MPCCGRTRRRARSACTLRPPTTTLLPAAWVNRGCHPWRRRCATRSSRRPARAFVACRSAANCHRRRPVLRDARRAPRRSGHSNIARRHQMNRYIVTHLAASLILAAASPLHAQTADDLKKEGSNTDNILTYGMGYGQQRYSPLDQMDKRNVKKLVPVWSLSLENDFGEQAQPLIRDGVMYVSDAKWTVAIDVRTGKQLWRNAVDFDPDTPRVVCCGVSSKGVALYNGLVLRGTLDADLVALDQKTGKEDRK